MIAQCVYESIAVDPKYCLVRLEKIKMTCILKTLLREQKSKGPNHNLIFSPFLFTYCTLRFIVSDIALESTM